MARSFRMPAATFSRTRRNGPRIGARDTRARLYLVAASEIFARREHAAAQQFFPAAAAHFLRPVHPTVLAQAEKVPRVLVRRHAQVIEPEQHHARSAVRPLERRLAG